MSFYLRVKKCTMSKIHENAALTISQRKLLRSLYIEGASISSLARRFGVNKKCAERWAKRESPLASWE